jgi:hypothetical protein
MTLPLAPVYWPMDALSTAEPPSGPEWQYEPKWDGFRCLAFRDGPKVDLQSKSGQPLGRYFPEIAGAFLQLKPQRFVLDGELVVPVDHTPSFDHLLMRIHPAASRVRKLSEETPALFIAFDLLVGERGNLLANHPLRQRRARLNEFIRRYARKNGTLRLSPATESLPVARRWFHPQRRPRRTYTQSRTVDQAARVYRPGARRAQPMEHAAVGGMGATRSQTGYRGSVRPLLRRPVSAWNQVPALAPRQVAVSVHDRPSGTRKPHTPAFVLKWMITNGAQSERARLKPNAFHLGRELPMQAALHQGATSAVPRTERSSAESRRMGVGSG